MITPEAVVLDLPLAGVGSRGLAYLLDTAIVGTVAAVVALSVGITGGTGGWAVVVVGLLALFALVYGYPVAFETLWRGRTPGKAALGLRVVTVEGAPVAFRHAAIRAAFAVVDFHATAGVAAITSTLLTERSQRLGDVVAGTVVLRERSGAPPPTAHRFAPPPGLEDLADRLDVTGLVPAQYAPVREFLLRAGDLPGESRRRLARQLATRIGGLVRPGPPDEVAPEAYLRCVAAAVQARRGPPGDSRSPTSHPTAARSTTGETSTATDGRVPPPPPRGSSGDGFAPPE